MKEVKIGEAGLKPVEYADREFCPMINGKCKKEQCVAFESTDKKCKWVRWG